ncbi:hypothetical protein ACSQ67_001398 [Phaseolus vulgaris]
MGAVVRGEFEARYLVTDDEGVIESVFSDIGGEGFPATRDFGVDGDVSPSGVALGGTTTGDDAVLGFSCSDNDGCSAYGGVFEQSRDQG